MEHKVPVGSYNTLIESMGNDLAEYFPIREHFDPNGLIENRKLKNDSGNNRGRCPQNSFIKKYLIPFLNDLNYSAILNGGFIAYKDQKNGEKCKKNIIGLKNLYPSLQATNPIFDYAQKDRIGFTETVSFDTADLNYEICDPLTPTGFGVKKSLYFSEFINALLSDGETHLALYYLVLIYFFPVDHGKCSAYKDLTNDLIVHFMKNRYSKEYHRKVVDKIRNAAGKKTDEPRSQNEIINIVEKAISSPYISTKIEEFFLSDIHNGSTIVEALGDEGFEYISQNQTFQEGVKDCVRTLEKHRDLFNWIKTATLFPFQKINHDIIPLLGNFKLSYIETLIEVGIFSKESDNSISLNINYTIAIEYLRQISKDFKDLDKMNEYGWEKAPSLSFDYYFGNWSEILKCLLFETGSKIDTNTKIYILNRINFSKAVNIKNVFELFIKEEKRTCKR